MMFISGFCILIIKQDIFVQSYGWIWFICNADWVWRDQIKSVCCII